MKDIISTLSPRDRAEFILDLFHRTMIHHTLWFREAEHQFGFEKALAVMDLAYPKIRAIQLRRLSEIFDFTLTDDLPDALLHQTEEEHARLADAAAKNWLAMDGVWFQAVEQLRGMNDAKRCNDSVWTRFSPLEAHSIKKLLHLPKQAGLGGLETALRFRLYGRLNEQECRYLDDNTLLFTMSKCRVQAARKRQNLPDYPCKSAGLVEYRTFAETIDSRIETTCIACPPDDHPDEWHCAWKFSLRETAPEE